MKNVLYFDDLYEWLVDLILFGQILLMERKWLIIDLIGMPKNGEKYYKLLG